MAVRPITAALATFTGPKAPSHRFSFGREGLLSPTPLGKELLAVDVCRGRVTVL